MKVRLANFVVLLLVLMGGAEVRGQTPGQPAHPDSAVQRSSRDTSILGDGAQCPSNVLIWCRFRADLQQREARRRYNAPLCTALRISSTAIGAASGLAIGAAAIGLTLLTPLKLRDGELLLVLAGTGGFGGVTGYRSTASDPECQRSRH